MPWTNCGVGRLATALFASTAIAHPTRAGGLCRWRMKLSSDLSIRLLPSFVVNLAMRPNKSFPEGGLDFGNIIIEFCLDCSTRRRRESFCLRSCQCSEFGHEEMPSSGSDMGVSVHFATIAQVRSCRRTGAEILLVPPQDRQIFTHAVCFYAQIGHVTSIS